MSEVDYNEDIETEVENEVEVDPIGDFIDSIAAGKYNQAETSFNSLLADKVQTALEAEKISVADTIFNGAAVEDEEEELSDYEFGTEGHEENDEIDDEEGL